MRVQWQCCQPGRLVLLLVGVVALVGCLGVAYMIRMPGRSYTGPLPPLTVEEAEVRQRLARHVWTLAGEIGERNLWRYEAFDTAAQYIAATLQGLGYQVATQEFT